MDELSQILIVPNLNRFEFLCGLDPRVADSDGNGVPDGSEDADFDGLSNAREAQLGTSVTFINL